MGEPRDFKFGTLTYHSKSHPADEKYSLIGAWSGSGEPFLEFYTPCNFFATANARDFKFCTRVGHESLSLVMSECFLSGRGQGHESNYYIVDLQNFATASRRYTGDIQRVGLFMTPIRQ